VKNIFLSLLIIGFGFQVLMAQTYELPPTSKSYGHVPVISDEAMEKCVKLYNEAKWLSDEIQNTYVDQYSQSSVDKYNKKITKHSEMIKFFNQNCAGKQSESAYRAAQKLNNQLQNYKGR
jgi:hypothetical protein